MSGYIIPDCCPRVFNIFVEGGSVHSMQLELGRSQTHPFMACSYVWFPFIALMHVAIGLNSSIPARKARNHTQWCLNGSLHSMCIVSWIFKGRLLSKHQACNAKVKSFHLHTPQPITESWNLVIQDTKALLHQPGMELKAGSTLNGSATWSIFLASVSKET